MMYHRTDVMPEPKDISAKVLGTGGNTILLSFGESLQKVVVFLQPDGVAAVRLALAAWDPWEQKPDPAVAYREWRRAPFGPESEPVQTPPEFSDIEF